ncbi:hypothetical protein [Saccharothrix sp. NRRL B-16348]|uniref:hypothetical protein n=1 Tax=Saccharothrix sp. NRRL B-16348 TaxID=1415542 RepID=UPI0012FA75C1|nr:hypothetical protein [Saccharothrix sp. NRRL B-16348]
MNIWTRAGVTAAAVAAVGAGMSVPAMAETGSASGSPTVMAGSTTQSRNGLTCNNQWFTTLGKTNCTGNSGQRWRLKLTCQFQGDILGTWQTGAGSDQNECTVRVTGASVQWG